MSGFVRNQRLSALNGPRDYWLRCFFSKQSSLRDVSPFTLRDALHEEFDSFGPRAAHLMQTSVYLCFPPEQRLPVERKIFEVGYSFSIGGGRHNVRFDSDCPPEPVIIDIHGVHVDLDAAKVATELQKFCGIDKDPSVLLYAFRKCVPRRTTPTNQIRVCASVVPKELDNTRIVDGHLIDWKSNVLIRQGRWSFTPNTPSTVIDPQPKRKTFASAAATEVRKVSGKPNPPPVTVTSTNIPPTTRINTVTAAVGAPLPSSPATTDTTFNKKRTRRRKNSAPPSVTTEKRGKKKAPEKDSGVAFAFPDVEVLTPPGPDMPPPSTPPTSREQQLQPSLRCPADAMPRQVIDGPTPSPSVSCETACREVAPPVGDESVSFVSCADPRPQHPCTHPANTTCSASCGNISTPKKSMRLALKKRASEPQLSSLPSSE